MQEEQNQVQTENVTVEAEKATKPLSDEKKSALMRYMAIMFAVAFVLVLVSFLIQNHSSNEQITQLSASANDLISRAENLQTQNRTLEDAKNELEEENEQLTERLDTLKNEKAENQKESSVLKETVETYEALITAMNCTTREGNLTFSKAMETLKYNQKYLSEPAKAMYRTLLKENAGE